MEQERKRKPFEMSPQVGAENLHDPGAVAEAQQESEAAGPVPAGAEEEHAPTSPQLSLLGLDNNETHMIDEPVAVPLEVSGAAGDLVAVSYDVRHLDLHREVHFAEEHRLDATGRVAPQWSFKPPDAGRYAVQIAVRNAAGQGAVQEVIIDVVTPGGQKQEKAPEKQSDAPPAGEGGDVPSVIDHTDARA